MKLNYLLAVCLIAALACGANGNPLPSEGDSVKEPLVFDTTVYNVADKKDTTTVAPTTSAKPNTTTPAPPTPAPPTPAPPTPAPPTPAPPTPTPPTPAPKTTTPAPDTTSTTVKPSPTPAPTPAPTPTPAPAPTPTPAPDTTPKPSTTAAPSTTTEAPKPPVPCKRFDAPSFIGGIVLTLGILVIAFIAYKFYRARNELHYQTL